MFNKTLLFALLFAILLMPSSVFAGKGKKIPDAGGAEAIEKKKEREKYGDDIPRILNPLYRHNKKHQFEFTPYGGAYLGNSIGQTWLVGSKLYFYLNNTVGIGANWSYSRLLTNRGSPFGSVLRDENMYVVNSSVLISNDVALRIGEDVLEMDFYVMLGPGAMYLNKRWEIMGEVGGGVKIYTGVPWLAFRIDLDGYAHNTSQPGKDAFDFDFVITGGVSFLFPIKPPLIDKRRASR